MPLLCLPHRTSSDSCPLAALAPLLLPLHPFCVRGVLPGTWAASCAGSLLRVLGGQGCGAERGQAGLGSVPESLQNPQGPWCVLAGYGHAGAASRLRSARCSSTLWLEDVGVVAGVFCIFILQISFLGENKSLAVCVSLQYALSALPPPPSLLPALRK